MTFFGLDKFFDYVGSFGTSNKHKLPQRNFDQPDLPNSIKNSIDWKNSAVAGSFALHQFTGATNWQPNDIDIMVACQTKEEFLASAQAFENKSQAILVRHAWFDPNKPTVNTETSDDEKFHESVLGSRTYYVSEFDKKIQLICLKQSEARESPAEILSLTTDIPACVSYTMFNGEKVFQIPARGREILLTNRGPKTGICASRYEHYLSRGYEFY